MSPTVRGALVRLRGRRPRPIPLATSCRAPSVSMYLDQQGRVRACCQNASFLLGKVTESSLHDIWTGPAAQQLRDALAVGDLSHGCDFCSWQVDAGRPELAYARTYDEVDPSGPAPSPPWPTQLELSLSNTCNLQCVMCNGEWSSSIRAQREGRAPLPKVYDERFFEDLRAFIPHLRTVKVLGGEPFLAAETLRVMDLLVEAGSTARVQFTTNGTQWSPRVERVLSSLRCDVIVSLDSVDPATYAAIRQGAELETVLANLERYRAAIGDRGKIVITTCIMTSTWEGFVDVCAFADAQGVEMVVNTVSDPPELSLFRLDPDALAPIVSAMDAIDGERGASLGSTRALWDAERTRLRSHLEERRAGRDIGWLDHRQADQVWAEEARALLRRRAEGLDELVATHVGPDAIRLVLDGTTVVEATGPGADAELLGRPVASLSGGDIAGLFAEVIDELGDPGEAEELHRDDLDRVATRSSFPTGPRVRSLSVPDPSGAEGRTLVWIAVEPEADPPAVAG